MEMVSLPSGNTSFGNGAMKRQRKGFTIIELITVIMIGAALTSFAIKGFGVTAQSAATRQARNVFNGMAARARAQAVESGWNTVLIADARGDSVMIMANGRIVENVRFAEEMDVDIQGTQDVTRLCLNPRGYANPSCTSFSSPVKVSFVAGEQTRTVEILPLGQLRW